MQHRIFIAINLSEDAKKKLQNYQQEWAELPVRFTKKDSLHLTLFFIGYVNDEKMLEICQKTREIAKKHKAFELSFNRICYGPPGKSPRLIWLEGERSEALINLKQDIEGMMVAEEDSRVFEEIERELKIFVPHITMARVRRIEWKKLVEKPVIDKKVSINISVNAIEVMESNLKHDGSEYVVLESVELSH